MTKNTIIVVLVLMVLALTDVCVYQSGTIRIAQAYINNLENDFPEYIDTTSGDNAYSEYMIK